MFWLLLWMLAQPGVCEDRSPGLSKCVEYTPRTVDGGIVTEWNCGAACYRPNHKDGGTDGEWLRARGGTKDGCRATLEKTCASPAGK